MAGGINFRIGGVLDPSFKGALSQSVTEAKAATKQITAAQENQYASYYTRLVGTSARARQVMAADAMVAESSKKMLRAMGGGWDGQRGGIQSERDELARALRARRALRNIVSTETTPAARAAGREAHEAFVQGFVSNAHRGGGIHANKGFGGAASAMFVSVARDTAASMASGANPITVFMQQAPQVLQALTMLGRGALATAVQYAGLGAAIIGLPASFYLLTKAMAEAIFPSQMLADQYENLTRRAQAMREALLSAREDDIFSIQASSQEMRQAEEMLSLTEQRIEAEAELRKQKITNALLDAKKNGNLAFDFSTRRQLAAIDLEVLNKKLENAQTIARNRSIGESEREKLRAELASLEMERDAEEKRLIDARAAVDKARPLSKEKKAALTEYDKLTSAAIANDSKFRNRQMELEKKIEDSYASGDLKAQVAIASIKAKIAAAEGQITAATNDEYDEFHKPGTMRDGNSSFLGLTDRQRAGAQVGGPAVALLDVARSTHQEIRGLRQDVQRLGDKGGGRMWNSGGGKR